MEYDNGSVVVAVIAPAQLSVAVGKVVITVLQSPVISGRLIISGTGSTLSPTVISIVKTPSQDDPVTWQK